MFIVVVATSGGMHNVHIARVVGSLEHSTRGTQTVRTVCAETVTRRL